MVTRVFALPRDREIDWEAAAEQIRAVPLQQLWHAGELYPWEGWLEDVGNLPGAKPAFTALRAAQADLHADAVLLRAELEAEPRRIIRFELPSHIGWVVGGPSGGMLPDDIIAPLIGLAEAGVLGAAGFTRSGDYIAQDLDDRRVGLDAEDFADRPFGFGPEDERRTHVGIAGAHVAERAATLARPSLEAPITDRHERCTELLRNAEDGRTLIEAAAQLLLLISWLLEPGEEVFDARLERTMLDAVWTWDPDDYDDVLVDVPTFRTHREVAHEAMRRLMALQDMFDEIAEWQVGGDCDYDGPVDEDLAARLKIEPLAVLLGGLADLHGMAIGELLDWPPRPIPASPVLEHLRVGGGLLVLAVAHIDWHDLRSRIDPAGTHYDRLIADLHELRQVLDDRPYRRYAAVDEVADHRVLVAAPRFELEWPDVGLALLRLHLTGVLQGDGIVWFDADGYKEEHAFPVSSIRRVLPAVAPERTVPEPADDPWGDLEKLASALTPPEEQPQAEGPVPPYDYCNGDPLECIDGPRGCGGDIALRHPGQGDWRWPRCEAHGARRLGETLP